VDTGLFYVDAGIFCHFQTYTMRSLSLMSRFPLCLFSLIFGSSFEASDGSCHRDFEVSLLRSLFMKICRVCISFHRCLCLPNVFMGVAGESQSDHKEVKVHCITTKEACISAITICVFKRSLYFVNCVMPVESRVVKVQIQRKCLLIQIHLFFGQILTIISVSLMIGTSLASFKSAASFSSKESFTLILSFKTDSLY